MYSESVSGDCTQWQCSVQSSLTDSPHSPPPVVVDTGRQGLVLSWPRLGYGKGERVPDEMGDIDIRQSDSRTIQGTRGSGHWYTMVWLVNIGIKRQF